MRTNAGTAAGGSGDERRPGDCERYPLERIVSAAHRESVRRDLHQRTARQRLQARVHKSATGLPMEWTMSQRSDNVPVVGQCEYRQRR